MAWVWLDDQMPDHPRIASVSLAALGAFIAGLCYCSRMRTDGYLPANVAHRLAPSRNRSELERAEMWRPAEGGYQVRDYLDYQPSAEELERQSVSNRERQRRWRESKRNGVTNGAQSANVTGTPTPTDLNPPVPPSRGGKLTRAERKARARVGAPKTDEPTWRDRCPHRPKCSRPNDCPIRGDDNCEHEQTCPTWNACLELRDVKAGAA